MEEDSNLAEPLLVEGRRRGRRVSFGEEVTLSASLPSSAKSVSFGETVTLSASSLPAMSRPASNNPSASSVRELPRKTSYVDRRSAWPRSLSERSDRGDHMEQLIQLRRESMKLVLGPDDCPEEVVEDPARSLSRMSASVRRAALEDQSAFVTRLRSYIESTGYDEQLPPLEVRLDQVNYRVPSRGDTGENSIATIWNSSPLYNMQKIGKKIFRRGEEVDPAKQPRVTNVLTDVNLVLRPRRMYLVLGPPLSGKTSLLRAIAGNIPQGVFTKKQRPDGGEGLAHLTGRVLYNNLVAAGDDADGGIETLVKNLGAFVRQTDSHAPRLTVGETFLFAGECKDDQILKNKRGYDPHGKVGITLEGLNLAYVKDTYVGNESIRGVSGGQRRRVTLGEMLVFDTPLLCGDEISTGLDTASTVEILSILSFVSRLLNQTTVISLLQPSPEAVSLFDEIILLGDGGRVIYSGPTEDAATYFQNLGYAQPESMDNADYLLGVSSSDRYLLYRGEGSASGGAHTTEELAELFRGSRECAKIERGLRAEWDEDWKGVFGKAVAPGSGGGEDEGGPGHVERYSQKYKNPFWTSVVLNMKRSFKLWKRDRTFIRAGIIKNLAMGLSVGAVFLNTDVNSSFFGVLFQGNLFIMLGAMTSAPDKVDDRAIFYKHADSNFYPALAYIIGQALALIPQMLLDVLLFGTCVYWMVGFVATAKGFFLYLALFFSFNFTMGQLFGCLASFAPSRTVVQAGGALILLLNTLFCGYIVAPTVIPPYYMWLYWSMPLSWVYRALLLNEFTSKDYQDGSGDEVMEAFGFLHNNEPYNREWVAYCFAYLLPFCGLCMILSAVCLTKLRLDGAHTGTPDMPTEDEEDDVVQLGQDDKPQDFVPVNLSFENLSYGVKASTGSEQITLLDNISGVFQAGRMCALMGESGAGKTTLLDVISMRKHSGNVTGEITLNGFPQEAIGFRRCSGYVEQFDVQSAELTVRETIRFSAQLRLDSNDPVYDSVDGIEGHIDTIIKALELTREADVLVGSEDDGGLTFEQKKRLSIAVELAANPSIVFLDEPTSGLDARAAMLVMIGLRKICDSGRTVVATIHQPSSAVFDNFDDLLLLKKGGKTVFFGELGPCSSNLVQYFEGLGCSPMNKGENPATWMLNAIAEKIVPAGGDERFALDFSSAWQDSQNNQDLKERLTEIIESKDEALEIKYDTQFAAKRGQRNTLMARRLVTIYWRSPAYNLTRMMLSLLIATLLSTVFIRIRRKGVLEEAEMVSYLSTIFISFIIIGVLSITSVLPVMLSIRDMYYRHKEAGMLDSRSVARALATAEMRFILISSVLFCLVFIPVSGIDSSAELKRRAAQGIGFWGFFTFNTAIYSYIGQLFMCSVRGQGTAQILASIFIGINNFFSGLIVRPQQMTGLWEFTYWINPGHYVYEGLCMVVFSRDKNRFVTVANGSDYYDELCVGLGSSGPCQVTVATYVNAFFGGLYKEENIPRNIIILGAILLLVRALTFVALRRLTYSSK